MNRKTTSPKETEIKIFASPELPSLVKLWILRALVRLGGKNKLIEEDGFSNDSLASAIGFKRWLFPSKKEYDRHEVTNHLYKLYINAEKRRANTKSPVRIFRNLNKLAEELNLSEIEVSILTFAVLIKTYNILEETLDLFGSVNSTTFYHGLSVILDINVNSIKKALTRKGILIQSGLMSVTNDGACFYDSRIDLLSSSFASYIVNYSYDPVILLSGIIDPTAKTRLALSDYEYLKKKLDILLLYLKKSYISKRKGVNILFYGLPGTGKTQLAKVLADTLSVELYNVSSENCDGAPITGIKRLSSLSDLGCFLGVLFGGFAIIPHDKFSFL